MKEPLKCIIVDDEEGAHLVIEYYLKGLSTLSLSGSFFNAIDAMNFIYQHQVDVVFLDINMPGLSGMEMLKAMSDPPLIVLTTAYAEFALESYQYQVVDYLVKPIEFPRFLVAVDNVLSRYRISSANDGFVANGVNYLMAKVDGEYIRILLDDILYIQSWGNYVKIYTIDAVYISSITTAEIEQKLDKTKFKRIHKSYIVGLHRIQKIHAGEVVLVGNQTIPIGNTFRRELIEFFS